MAAERSYKHDFELRLRRQGWHLIRTAALYDDPRVIAVRQTVSPRNINGLGGATAFFKLFGQKTVRKLMRAILSSEKSEDDLRRICPNTGRLHTILDMMASDGLIRNDNGIWKTGPEVEGIHDIGATVEW